MFTDMVGYTALGQRNEALSLALVEEQRKLIRPILARHSGREVKTIGDAFLVVFPNALDAARCGYDIQRAVRDFNLSMGQEKRIHLRIGIHVGEIVEDQSDISGDAVNVASRIEPLAEDGGVCVSRQVYDHVRGKLDIPLSTLGQKSLKNVTELVEVYRMVMPWEKEAGASPEQLDKNRIAVLPFANMSPDPTDEYFADGMTEELIDRLAQVKELKVIARTSVMSYKKKEKKASEIAKELGVGSLVEGSVRKAGNRVRVTVQLINSGNEEHLWSSHYDKDLDDIFGVQSDIAEKVAGELKIRLLEDERRVIEKKPTENTEAYTYYLRGKQLVGERTEPSLRQAMSVFEKAIALDPTFAKAHAGLAESCLWLVNDQYEPYELLAPKAELAATKAIQLDQELAEAHAALSNVYFLEDHLRAGLVEAQRAIELNPSLPDAYDNLCDIALLKQEVDEGIKAIETAHRLDPVMPRYVERLGRYYFYMGRENDALKHWEATAHLNPAGTFRNLAEYHLSKGDMAKAKEFHLKAHQLEPTNRWGTWMRGFLAAWAGDKDAALAVMKEIEGRWMGATNLNDLAFIHYGLGDLDSYYAYVNRAAEQHTVRFAYVMYCPLFAKARQDPRYQEFLVKIKTMADS